MEHRAEHAEQAVSDAADSPVKQAIRDKLIGHKQYIARHGDDMPEITGWRWGQAAPASGRAASTEVDNV